MFVSSQVEVAFSPPSFPSASLRLCVIIPIRNEASGMVKTLDALRMQTDLNNAPIGHENYEILLLTNNCIDDSYKIAKNYQLAWPGLALRVADVQLPAEHAHIGTARRLLMDEAYRRFMLLGKHHGIIASTDGDTEVDAAWIYNIIDEMTKGVDAVGGRILVNPHSGEPSIYHGLDETYRMLIAKTESILDPLAHDPWPCHYQFFGASLAVTCKMYDSAGRLPQLPYLEDAAFCKALLRRDAKIRRSPAVKVTTSSRTEGRVDIGLSEQLRKWAHMERAREPHLVAPAAEIISRATQRSMLRSCWKATVEGSMATATLLPAAAASLGIETAWLQKELAGSAFFGPLWEKTEQQLQAAGGQNQWAPVEITQAIEKLTAFIKAHAG